MSAGKNEICTVCHDRVATREISVSCTKLKSNDPARYEYTKPIFSAFYVVCNECSRGILDVKVNANLTRPR